jgi:hypothetical protein
MRHVVVNNMGDRVIRLCLDPSDGEVIYSGHKLGIDQSVLSEVLQYYYDKSSGRFMFLDYVRWDRANGTSPGIPGMSGCLFSDAPEKGLVRSYESLLELATSKLGRFRKIQIVRDETAKV